MTKKLFVVFLSLFMAIGSGPAYAGFISDKWNFDNDGSDFVVEGTTDDAYETTVAFTEAASSDKTITFPNSTGYVALDTTGATAGNILLETEIDASSELLAIMDDETGTGLLTFATAPTFTTSIQIGSAGVLMSDDGDGAITILGAGNGTDEDLTLNLDDTSNTAVVSSSTGVTSITLTGMGVTSTATTDLGWAVVAGANTACNTTCTSACVFGVNTAATEADIVACTDATADECLCAGAS